jgi:chromosome segregation ATPase
VNTLLEKLNEMLFEPGDTEAATNEKQPEQTRQESPKPEPVVAQEARAGESTNTTEMLQFLQSKVANHSPGSQETLAKFAKNLQVLEEFIPDENVRYRAAASQASVPALLKAYGGCREALAAATSEFKQAVTAASESQIKQKRDEVTNLEREIGGLSERLTSLVGQRDALATELVEHELKIKQKDEEFTAAARIIAAEIAENETKLKRLSPIEKEAK